jgi:hypothetical protein
MSNPKPIRMLDRMRHTPRWFVLPQILFVCLLLLTGCSSLIKTTVNKKFPKRSLEEIRVKNLQDQTATLERLTRADVAVHFSRHHIDSLVHSGITKWFGEGNTFGIEGVKKLSLVSPATITLNKQSVEFAVKMKVEFTKESKPGRYIRTADIILEGLVIPVTNDTTVILTSNILNLRISKLKLRGIFQLLWVIKPIINSFFIEFRENINGYLAKNPIVIPVKIKPLPETDIADIIDSNQLKVEGNTSIKVNKRFGPVSIKIDESGIDLIAEMVDLEISEEPHHVGIATEQILQTKC